MHARSKERVARAVKNIWLAFFVFVLTVGLTVLPSYSTTIPDIINLVSETQFRTYQNSIEDCGLGLYGGSAYNNGSRSRKWHEPPPPNKGNQEVQLYMGDKLRLNPRMVVTVPSGVKQNVLAELPGYDPVRKDDIYIISGHIDTTGDTNRPGGDDNSGGSAGVLEAARVMSQFKYKATIQFIGFNGEEGGHYGSVDYVNNLTPSQKSRIKGVINMDMILHPRNDGVPSSPLDVNLWCIGTTQPLQIAWMNTFRAAASTYVPQLLVYSTPDERGSSDHQSFGQSSPAMPAFTLIEFDVNAWLNQGANAEYHTSRDYRNYEPNGAGNGYLKDLHWNYTFATNVVKATVATIAQEAEIVGPVYGVQVTNITANSATITWKSLDPGTSQVDYGFTTSYGSSTPQDPAMVTEHSVTITGLISGGVYHFRAVSVIGGVAQYSDDMTFQTLKIPVISNVTATSVTGSSAIITWDTDVAADSKVDYDYSVTYGLTTGVYAAPVTSHSMLLSGLVPATVYHFRVASTNVVGTAVSGDYTFTTTANPADVIIDNTDPGFQVTLGQWTVGSLTGIPKWGANYLYVAGTGNSAESSATAKCTWTPNLTLPGLYDVYAFYQKGTNRTTSATYNVTSAGGTFSSSQNQNATGPAGDFYRIGQNLTFAAGTGGFVQLANNTPDSLLVSADAVKFSWVGQITDNTLPSTPLGLIASVQSTTQINLAWNASTDNLVVVGYRIYAPSLKAITAATSYLDTGLQPNTTYNYQVSAYDLAFNESIKSAVVPATTKSVPPSSSTVSANKVTGSWLADPNVSFTAIGGFGPGKISAYEYAWGTSSTHTFTGDEPHWSASSLNLTVPTGAAGYYLHVRGLNAAGDPNGTYSIGPFKYDGTAPTGVGVTTDRRYLSAGESFIATWTGSDPESGLANYQYRVRDGDGGTLVNWQATTATSAVVSGGQVGKAYYVDVKASNQAGSSSAVVSSPVVKYVPIAATVGLLKTLPESSDRMLKPVVLTANFGTHVYVQDGKYNGIRVDAAAALPVGSVVYAAGSLVSVGGELMLTDGEVRTVAGTLSVAPVTVGVDGLGGVDASPQALGVTYGQGPNNIGLLVSFVGVVTRSQAGDTYFYVKDATGWTDSSGLGVKIISGVWSKPVEGELIKVTGISAFEVDGGNRVPVLKMNKDIGFTVLAP